MHSRKTAGSEGGSNDTVGSKTGRSRNAAEGDAKNGEDDTQWEESVLEKWRGALVKARLALRKKREKKKESTLARLRKIADAAARDSSPPESSDDDVPPLKKSPPKKRGRPRGRPPLASNAGNAQGLAAAEGTSTKVLKKARLTSENSQSDDGVHEPIPSVTKVKRGRKPKSSLTSTALDAAEDHAGKDHVARLRAEMARETERKEEIRNKWRNALAIARSALQQKRQRRKEQAQKRAITRLRRSEDEAVQDHAQVVFSLRRPSLEELRNFAKKSRC